MDVEYVSLKRHYELYQSEYEQAALRILRSGWFILGPELEKFEKEFAHHIGRKYCIGVNSGTDALILALRALGISEGDEVIVPAGSYIASVIGVTENGATPVFIDSDDFFLMDAKKIENAITPRTKAILPVHMYGQSCDMNKIMEIANKHSLFVVEDCAQSHDAAYDGKKTGTFGIMGCFSFYPTKPLGALGDAGAVLTDNEEMADKVRMLRNYGSKRKYQNEITGINSRMDELQAALLRVGLKHIKEDYYLRERIACKYMSSIRNSKVKLPKIQDRATHSYHLFPLIVDNQDFFRDYLKQYGIKTQIHYPVPPYCAECYQKVGHVSEDFEKANYIAKHEVSLPIYAGMPEEEAIYVVDVVNSY